MCQGILGKFVLQMKVTLQKLSSEKQEEKAEISEKHLPHFIAEFLQQLYNSANSSFKN